MLLNVPLNTGPPPPTLTRGRFQNITTIKIQTPSTLVLVKHSDLSKPHHLPI